MFAQRANGLSLLFFVVLAVVVTYPLVAGPGEFTVLSLYTDDLLQAWILDSNIHAFLSGPQELLEIWNANIFYPYPLTLAFMEHLFASSAILMPVALLGDTPLVATNGGVLFTTVLSGWGTYLLVTWLTGNRWAGLLAGVAFAVAPYRLSHITQLNLLSTHWIPFILLALARLIKLGRSRDLVLLILFTNLQFFSAINYAVLVAIAMAIWGAAFLYLYRRQIFGRLWGYLLIFAVLTVALNWPVLRVYQQVSDQMGVVRTLADARVYGAFIVNYILPIGNSLLYGRWLGLPTSLDYNFAGIGVFVSTFPGLVVLVLGVSGIVLGMVQAADRRLRAATAALAVMIFVGFTLSFGANDKAFGPAWAAWVEPWLPYPYLYHLVPVLQGFRGTIRFGLLVTFGLAILAGLAFAQLERHFQRGRRQVWLAIGLILLIILEHLPAPLPVVSTPYRQETVYAWLAENTPADAVLMELPYYLHTPAGERELLRNYQSTRHWRRLVNGASGFKPAHLTELGQVVETFPNWQSFDLLRQLGVTHIVLHVDAYEPAAWETIEALLPAYFPAIERIHTVGDARILALKPPACIADSDQIQVSATTFPQLSIRNENPATWVADPRRASRVTASGRQRDFLEPLFVLPGESKTFTIPAPNSQAEQTDWRVTLSNLQREFTPEMASPEPAPAALKISEPWQPVQIPFENGAILQAVAMSRAIKTCDTLDLSLQWNFSGDAGETSRVEILDQFDRLVTFSETQPVQQNELWVSSHQLPLAETLPPGRYRLRVRLLAPDGRDVRAVGPEGAPIDAPVALPIVIRPGDVPEISAGQPLAVFDETIQLLAVDLAQSRLDRGEWLRFALTWQTEQPIETDFVVFTQLLGPDGRVWGQRDNQPKGGWYGTSLWQPGRPVVDDYAFQLQPDAPPGEYRLIVGLYYPDTLERLSTQSGGDFVEVGAVVVE